MSNAIKGYRAPTRYWTDDHPWIVAFGFPGPDCSCCGAGLTRRAIVDEHGAVWGVDCYRTATGHRAKVPLAHEPCLLSVSPIGYRVLANNEEILFPLADGIPAALLDAMAPSDHARALRRMKRDGLA